VFSIIGAALFGPIYFFCKGKPGWAIVDAIVIVTTLGVGHIIIALMAPWIVHRQLGPTVIVNNSNVNNNAPFGVMPKANKSFRLTGL